VPVILPQELEEDVVLYPVVFLAVVLVLVKGDSLQASK
jgi:hypothetical protein